jgi:histidyl-tRNA synthetase
MMQTLQIRLTKELIKEIKILIDLGIYPNVSEAVRDSVRMLVTSKEYPKSLPEAKKEEIKIIQEKTEQVQTNIQKEVKKQIKQFQAPKGTEDFYPEEINIRSKIFNVLRKNAENFGFKEVDSTVVEDLNLLKAKQGEEIVNQIFTIEKKGDEELALRAEFTPSLARMFISKQKELPKPVKWFCINQVFRYERPQQGRQRSFFQFNVETYGSSNPESDAEMINLTISSLKDLGLDENDFFVKINNRKLIQGLLLESVEKNNLEKVMRIIDKKNKITQQEFDEELNKLDIDSIKINNILDSDINKINPPNELAREGLKEIKKILNLLDDKFVKVDLETVRGLAYYTGTVFEIYDKEEKFRSIAGGGRYDNMIELFKGEPTPATGFGLGYSTLRLLLKEKNRLPKPELESDYYIAIVDESSKKKAFEIANSLRKKYKVDIDLMQRNLGNQFKYANTIKAKKVIVIGPDEIKTGKIKVKDMITGEQEEKEINDL